MNFKGIQTTIDIYPINGIFLNFTRKTPVPLKHYISLFCFIFITNFAPCQDFRWVTDMPIQGFDERQSISVVREGKNGRTWTARTDHYTQTQQDRWWMGYTAVEQRDSNSYLQSQIMLSGLVSVTDLFELPGSRLLIAGIYMTSFTINSSTTINHFSGPLYQSFLMSVDFAGNLIWFRNINSIVGPDYNISRVVADNVGNIWYGTENGTNVRLMEINQNGDSLSSLYLSNARTLGDFGFDASGNIYVTGATGSGTLNVAGLTTPVPNPFMTFLARINNNGTGAWIHKANDTLFQRPVLSVTPDDGVVVFGDLNTTSTWGSFQLNGPDWKNDFFLIKADSSGNILWARETPNILVPTGDLTRGEGRTIAVNGQGEILIGGVIRGSINWGNGKTSDSGLSMTNGSAFALIYFDPSGDLITSKFVISERPIYFGDLLLSGNNIYFSGTHRDGYASFDTILVHFDQIRHFFLARLTGFPVVNIPEYTREETLLRPNPAAEFVHLPESWKGKQINLYASNGTLVERIVVHGTVFSTSHLPDGLYYFSSREQSLKLVVMHQ